MKYLKELKEYKEMYNLSGEETLRVIRQGMIGKAGEWFAATQHLYEDVDAFQTIFQEQYWGDERQMEIRRALDTGEYHETGSQTRVDYATAKISSAKELTPPIDDKSIVYLLRQHFGVEIGVGIISHNVSSIPQFLALLARYDGIPQEERRPETNRRGRWDNQYPGSNEQHSWQGKREEDTFRQNQPRRWETTESRPRDCRAPNERRDGRRRDDFRGHERRRSSSRQTADRQRDRDDERGIHQRKQERPVNSIVVENSSIAKEADREN
jgi:hypothetical protein